MSTQETDARRRVKAVIGIVSSYTPDELSQAIRAAEQSRQGKNEAERFKHFRIYLLLRGFTEADYDIFQEQMNGYHSPVLDFFCAYIAQGSAMLLESEMAVRLTALSTE